MDDAFWLQAYGDKYRLLGYDRGQRTAPPRRDQLRAVGSPRRQRAVSPGAGPKPAGARFYPEDMSREEFEAAAESRPHPS